MSMEIHSSPYLASTQDVDYVQQCLLYSAYSGLPQWAEMLWDKWSRKLFCPISGLDPCLEVTSTGEQRSLWWSCREAKS